MLSVSTFRTFLIGAAMLVAPALQAQTTLTGNHFVDGNLSVNGETCIGDGCDLSNLNEALVDLRIKQNQIVLRFEDDSGGTNPTKDWEIKINDNFAGGEEYFAIRNFDDNRTVFRVEDGAQSSAMMIDDTSFVGLGTAIPATKLHLFMDDTPAIRLEQSGGLGNQIFDMGANEQGFFLRDATSNTLPIRVRPAAADGTLVVNPSGRVGINTSDSIGSVDVRANLDVIGDGLFRGANAQLVVENSSGTGAAELFKMAANGGSYFTLDNTAAGTTWFFVHENASPNRFIITDGVNDGPEMTLTADGVLTVEGGFVAGATTLNVPDYVFAEDYALRPLAEVARFIEENSHLPEVPSAAEIAETGLDMTDMQMTLLKKVEELTLYTLEQERTIAELRSTQARLIDALEVRLEQIE